MNAKLFSETPLQPALRVLYVDDDPGDTLLARETLRKLQAGCDFHESNNAVEVLERLQNLAETSPESLPDVVVLDLNMPRIDGRDFLSVARRHAQLASLPIIVFSTSDSPRDERECLALGADGYYIKPDDIRSWNTCLRQMIERAEAIRCANESPSL